MLSEIIKQLVDALQSNKRFTNIDYIICEWEGAIDAIDHRILKADYWFNGVFYSISIFAPPTRGLQEYLNVSVAEHKTNRFICSYTVFDTKNIVAAMSDNHLLTLISKVTTL